MVTDGDSTRIRPTGLAALVAAPLLAFIAAAITPTTSEEAAERLDAVAEHSTRFGLAVLLALASLAMFLLAAVALAGAVGRGAGGPTAQALAFVGVVASAALVGITWVDYHLAKQPARAVGIDLQDRITSGAAYVLLEIAALGISLAILLFAAGLLTRRIAGAAAAGALTLGALLVPIGSLALDDAAARALLLVGYGLLTLGFVEVARRLAR